MQKTMKALVKAKAEPGLWLQDVPCPEMGINDVMVKIHKTSICGTDVHIYNWDDWAQHTIPVPMHVGHEFVGVITEVGSNVKGFKVGDRVSGEGHIVCGRCRNCMAGRRHLCASAKGIGVNIPGAFAEYLALPAANAWLCDPEIPDEVFSCFDPLGNATHTALTYDLLGEDILITGAGPIGCMAAAIARHAGARYVVVTDINPYRLDLARKMGASLALDARAKSIADAQKELGMKEGFDVGLEMSGSPAALQDMLANMSHGGNIALLGLLPSGTPIDWNLVVFNGLNIKGIYGRQIFETWYKMTSMLKSGLDISQLITHTFPIDDYEEGFKVMCSGQSGKVVLNWI